MSRVDLGPITLEQLAHGSGMSACCDEAELRTNHDTLSARISKQYDPPNFRWGWVLLLIVVLGLASFAAGHMEPTQFNPFNR